MNSDIQINHQVIKEIVNLINKLRKKQITIYLKILLQDKKLKEYQSLKLNLVMKL